MSVDENREEVIEAIKENIAVLASHIPVSETGGVYEELCSQFQALGIYNLLSHYDAEGFHRNLILSVYGRIDYLEKSQAQSNNDSLYLAISRTTAMFAALASGQFDLAKTLVNVSSNSWREDGEYEDDFLYCYILHRIIQKPELSLNDMQAELDRFEEVLEGALSPRLSLLKALLTRDQDAFQVAFEDLLIAHEQYLDEIPSDNDPTKEAHAAIFIEGLGILSLARFVGLKPFDSYQYCPQSAQPAPGMALPGNLFQDF